MTQSSKVQEDAALMAARCSELEGMLALAPQSIALLGQLLVVAFTNEFKLDSPPTGFKHMADSFRVCVVQVFNGGYDALSSAHENMLQIAEHTRLVSNRVDSAMKVLGEEHEMLSNHIIRIQIAAKQCTKLAKETEDNFQAMVDLIEELQEACTATKELQAKLDADAALAVLVASKVQWVYLVQAFHEIYAFIDVTLGSSLKSFADQPKAAETIEASKVAYQVQKVAETYVNVFNAHLMDHLDMLNRLIVLEPSRDQAEIDQMQVDLTNRCKEAQDVIVAHAKESRVEMEHKFAAHIQEITNTVGKAPPLFNQHLKVLPKAAN